MTLKRPAALRSTCPAECDPLRAELYKCFRVLPDAPFARNACRSGAFRTLWAFGAARSAAKAPTFVLRVIEGAPT